MHMKQNITIENRKARYDYFIEDTLTCGIVLTGDEVKSIKDGRMNINQAYITIDNGELILKNAHISKWDKADKTSSKQEETRDRVLLARKIEIRKLAYESSKERMTLIPLRVFLNESGLLKIDVGLCKGKKTYDKRETIKQRDISREMER